LSEIIEKGKVNRKKLNGRADAALALTAIAYLYNLMNIELITALREVKKLARAL